MGKLRLGTGDAQGQAAGVVKGSNPEAKLAPDPGLPVLVSGQAAFQRTPMTGPGWRGC